MAQRTMEQWVYEGDNHCEAATETGMFNNIDGSWPCSQHPGWEVGDTEHDAHWVKLELLKVHYMECSRYVLCGYPLI